MAFRVPMTVSFFFEFENGPESETVNEDATIVTFEIDYLGV